jgi:putative membrane protein
MRDLEEVRNLGYFSLALSILLVVIGIIRFYQLKKHLKRTYTT